MKQYKHFVILLILVVLGSATAWYLTVGEKKQSSDSWERDFAVPDIERVHKIFIADRRGNTTVLERNRNGWLYDGKYPANPHVMKELLHNIQYLDVYYIPAHAAVKTMVNDLATKGIKVELYDAKGKNIKTYYLGSPTADGVGTYAIMEGAEKPYVVYNPSIRGSIVGQFMLTGDDWRDKTVIRENPERINYVSIEYPRQQNQSFVLEKKQGGAFSLRPFYDFTPRINKPLNRSIVEAYLQGFRQIGAEGYENKLPQEKRDSILQSLPFAVITIRNEDARETRLRLFPIETPVFNEAGETAVVIRYHVDWNGRDMVLMQHLLLKKILWGYSSFYE